MYRSQQYPEKYSLRRRQSHEDYELCNAGRKFIVQWSPRDTGVRYLARSRYASPGSLSKSVPRRNRGTLRFGINRSLNFDLGGRTRLSNYGSPNSSSDSNVSTENDNYLSRSAKILRALNIDYSPMKSAALGARRINKSLNFDLGPSPERRGSEGNSKRASSQLGSLSVSPLARINKTLNFETSSGESSVNSGLDSSLEFIDENQNQTPSHQRNSGTRKAKKSLDYSPKFVSSPSSNPSTPGLRSELREKIDDIVKTQGGLSVRNTAKRIDDYGASTPRNLFDELQADDDDNEPTGRPSTPENFVRIIPESMSAIKKSHKKERVLGRMGKTDYRVVLYEAEGGSKVEGMEVEDRDEENRPATPPPVINEHRYDSPQQCGIKSIKKSHKRDKSKRRSYGVSSEDEGDEMSETGSLFDYTTVVSEKKGDSMQEPEATRQPERDTGSGEDRWADERKVVPSVPLVIVSGPDGSRTPEKPGNSGRPETPENRVNFLQRVMTDSIKKSHKKVKDTNKRFFFKPRLLNPDTETRTEIVEPSLEDHRAGTPENTNSSRLLLSQFSSVKKSHRKDKHRRMISGTLQRKKYFEATSGSDSEAQNCSVSSNDFASPSSILREERRTNDISDDSRDASYVSLKNSPLDCRESGVDAITDLHKSSPNKRKNENEASRSFENNENSAFYESAEEEWKIFTPIKKRKSLNLPAPIARRICHDEATNENATNVTRCSTPRITRASGLRTSDNPEVPSTPEATSFVPIAEPSTPHQVENVNEGNAGRATPQNLSTAVLMAGMNSIKKSHKKDKRGNAATRRPLLDESSTTEDVANPIKTPPNCLQAKNYLRLLRTESIKRSHKKVRDRKRRDHQIEPELSDDGSIFDEAERSFEDARETTRNSARDGELRASDEPKETAETSSENEARNLRSGSACADDLSDDGSIFDSTEKLGSLGGEADDAD